MIASLRHAVSRPGVLSWIAVLSLVLGGGCGGGRSRSPGEEPPPFDPPPAADRRLDAGPPGAALSIFPRICCDGPRTYVVWYDRRDGDMDVYFNRSLDGGSTWLPADVRLDTDPPGAAGSNAPALACDEDLVVVAWEDQRDGASHVRLNRSADGGTTWLAEDVRVDSAASGFAHAVDVRCEGPLVWVVWHDDRDGEPDVRLNRSVDGGLTWLAEDLRLDTDVPGAAASRFPRIARAGGLLHVVWQDARDGEGDVRYQRSADGGATWLPEDVRLDVGTLPGASHAGPPVLCAHGLRVVVAWEDRRDGEGDIRVNASGDGGLTWLAQDVRVDTDLPGLAASRGPSICCTAQEVFLAWEDGREGLPDVRWSRSSDGGATWLQEDARLGTDGPGTATSFRPQVGCSEEAVYVTWYDDRAGRFDVLLQGSRDGGLTWWEREVRLDTDPDGQAHSLFPEICVEGGEARVVWFDERDGQGDVYFNRGPP